MEIETRLSVYTTFKKKKHSRIYLDYDSPERWTINLYGIVGDVPHVETWEGNPGGNSYHFQ